MLPELYAGPWQTALTHVPVVDAVITDPPYSARVHRGHDVAAEQVKGATGQEVRRDMGYDSMGPHDVDEFVRSWAPRCLGWMVVFSCDTLSPVWRQAMEDAGRQTFAPVWVRSFTPRLLGDGPSSPGVYLNVSRPRKKRMMSWGTLPAEYMHHKEKGMRVGGKSLSLMRAIVGDYTNPGDMVCDPFAGYGTTLQACREYGLPSIGAEVDVEAVREATERLTTPYTAQRHPRQWKTDPQPKQEVLL